MTAKELPGTKAPKGAAKKFAKAAKKSAKKSAKKVAETVAKKSAKKVASAAKKSAKKAAKKAAKGPGNDVRRAYEHLYRLHVLVGSLSAEVLVAVQTLSRFAQAALREERPRMAADLLRAGEHLVFGSLSGEGDEAAPSSALMETLREEYVQLLDRAAAQWEALDPSPARALRALYKAARTGAKAAWKARAFHRAMEFARAADALAHAAPGSLRLSVGEKKERMLP